MAHILIVDDEVDMLALLAKIITENTNHNVTTTNNSLEVSKLIKEGAVDLLFVSHKMPGMDGRDIAMGIRTDKFIPILITAYDSIYPEEDGIISNRFVYITKPFRKEQILIAINRALEFKNWMEKLNRDKDDRQREL